MEMEKQEERVGTTGNRRMSICLCYSVVLSVATKTRVDTEKKRPHALDTSVIVQGTSTGCRKQSSRSSLNAACVNKIC